MPRKPQDAKLPGLPFTCKANWFMMDGSAVGHVRCIAIIVHAVSPVAGTAALILPSVGCRYSTTRASSGTKRRMDGPTTKETWSLLICSGRS